MFFDRVVPLCSPSFLERHPVNTPGDVLNAPLIGIEWENPYQSPPSWSDWAMQIGLARSEPHCDLSFSLSSAAINDAGFVLGQASMVEDDLARGKLVVACDCWLPFSEPYALAWNRAALDRPFGREFRNFIVQAGRRLRRPA